VVASLWPRTGQKGTWLRLPDRRASGPGRVNIVTVTKLTAGNGEGQKCLWCRLPLDQSDGPGRPRRYCKRSCRQRDFEARQRAAAHGVDENDILLARSEVNRLRDEIFVLQCAVEDAERDLVDATAANDFADIVRLVLDAARGVISAQASSR
jgi:hypothetical protein